MKKIEATDVVRDEYYYRCCECKRVIGDEESMWLDEHGHVRCAEHAKGGGWTALESSTRRDDSDASGTGGA